MGFAVRNNVDLTSANTLRLPVHAQYYCEVYVDEEIAEAIAYAEARDLSLTILGDGSNVVLPPRIEGLTLHMRSQAITQEENLITAASGVNWHSLVMRLCEDGLCGLENLAGIPGSVGAAPVQNIGAYGVQVEETIVSVGVYDRLDGCTRVLSRDDCCFGYRDSIFKGAHRDRLIVTRVSFALSDHFEPITSYRDLQGADVTTPLSMATLVTRVRKGKLPDRTTTPNVGSFFKNPVLSESTYTAFRLTHPEAPEGVTSDAGTKIHAAWLIEQCGLKGHRVGGAMVSSQHALVIVNAGKATYRDIRLLAAHVQDVVSDRFNLSLEFEPTFYGN